MMLLRRRKHRSGKSASPLGEGYILENTWLSSDKTPNDPFDTFQTDGQADVLKRLPSGTYILEELKAPEGYVKGLPSGISVAETGELQHVQMVDRTTKIEISKIHAPQDTKILGSGYGP